MSDKPKRGMTSAGANRAEDTPIEFLDGVRVVPAWMVAHLGGPEALLKQAESLKLISYADFNRAFNEEVERDRLNQIQAGFIAGHFKRNPRK